MERDVVDGAQVDLVDGPGEHAGLDEQALVGQPVALVAKPQRAPAEAHEVLARHDDHEQSGGEPQAGLVAGHEPGHVARQAGEGAEHGVVSAHDNDDEEDRQQRGRDEIDGQRLERR